MRRVEIDVPAAPTGRLFVTWAPTLLRLRVSDAQGTDENVTLVSSGAVGRLLFGTSRGLTNAGSLSVTLPGDESWVDVFVAGEFPYPSVDYGDAEISITSSLGVDTYPAMVRIRKNAEKLTSGERDRFLDALARLNGGGAGRFRDFRDMHRTSAAMAEAHGDAGFLPWHRAYLLDLERELQTLVDEVALPYWRFDQPAPALFSLRFMGRPDSTGMVQFSTGHPLQAWVTDNTPGIVRRMSFHPGSAPTGLRTEAQTLRLGARSPGNPPDYAGFVIMERNPHGFAHTSFGGFVSFPPTAPRDPLFFLLHANVDRLWAKWQITQGTRDPAAPGAFVNGARVGHRQQDSMWPWNGVTNPPRPSTAPGGTLAASPVTPAPGGTPQIVDMIDYQASVGHDSLGFDYDDVPF